MAVDGARDSTKYNHDSALIAHRGEWILGWNGNVDPREGVPGQKNYFARGPEWNKLGGRPQVAEFQSAEWSVNPVNPDGVEWHPTLMEFAGKLECWWFATSTTQFPRSVAYRSVWDDKTRKWTNFKIQMLPRGRVDFSAKVGAEEPGDRLSINGKSYIAMPLATPVVGRNGELAMPMIISTAPTGGMLGGANEVVIFISEDQGKTWKWSGYLGKEPGDYRSTVWEPWMTWDGKSYHLFCRNFGAVPPGKGYSRSSTSDLSRWPPLADAPLDMMPMRGETVTDGSSWYVALSERAQIGTNFNSSKRRAMTLYRARNGEDWTPILPLLPAYLNAFYCWLYAGNDKFIYYSCSVPPGVAVGRISLSAIEDYSLNPENLFLVSANKPPFADGEKLNFVGSDYLRVPVSFQHGKGFSMAAYVRTGDALHGIPIDFRRRETKERGDGFLPTFDSGWLPKLPGISGAGLEPGLRPRTAEQTFIGVSFDEAHGVVRIVRRNSSDAWAEGEWPVRSLYLERIPIENTVTEINGVAYRWRAVPESAHDVAISPVGAENLERLASAILKNDPQVRGKLVSSMYSTASRGVRIHLMLLFATNPGDIRADGKCVCHSGNTFDVPTDSFTLNASNRATEPWSSPFFEAGMELGRLGLWNRQLSTADFKALFNSVAPAPGKLIDVANPQARWDSADVLLDPTRPEGLPTGVDWRGHTALTRGDNVTIHGDGAAAVEVPGRGNWIWEGEFRFDEFPVGLSWDLLSIGDKFSLGRLEVVRESESGYSLRRGTTIFCALKANEWTRIRLRYKDGDAVLELPTEKKIRVSVRPLMRLGRFLSDRIDPPEVNRPLPLRTEWRAIRLTAEPGAR